MWFKNARIYSVSLAPEHLKAFSNEELLEETIQKKAFKPCQAQEMSSIGFGPLFGKNSSAYTFTFGKNHFFSVVEENKLLPASVIKTELDIEVEEKEATIGRELKKNELKTLKTALVNKLLARAFASRRSLLVWVNSQYGYVGVAASSAKRAEQAIALIREAFKGTFPAKAFQPRCVVEDRMTDWIAKGTLPNIFTLGNDATLKSSSDDGGTVKISKDDLHSDEIISHIGAGKVITEIQLNYNETMSFVLSSDLILKRMRPDDQYLEKNLPELSEDALADIQSHLILQSDVLTSITNTLIEIFDCEKA